jgi:hypothetical protein
MAAVFVAFTAFVKSRTLIYPPLDGKFTKPPLLSLHWDDVKLYKPNGPLLIIGECPVTDAVTVNALCDVAVSDA